ncbi:MAG TPA: TIGR00730 family Rossman fold protein [Metalysinibacillus jejuensis]|uniref:Cytokinin riboside 5'-monophosphate phosphoribohydrolase n=1 Tax=Metalysinibacillus jejuensis TaxID=914327 RepID=A0A921T567_9BACL|nr:TIGR00730 family Rossman fold protein [Metalysinibacillus jejuensis]HJH11222.1 TIGR00730 family Rossman fold protein [Metalysinibacillus jejuensis]
MKIAVYCGSQLGVSQIFEETAYALGEQLATDGHTIVYGGSNVGLMGAVADAALSNGGAVIGVLPEQLKKREIAHEKLTELHFVESMHVRKAMMADMADAFIAYPGGVGTLDEFFEVFTWAHIGIHQKPVILFNVAGFYDDLIRHIERMIKEGFIQPTHKNFFYIATNLEEVSAILSNNTVTQ